MQPDPHSLPLSAHRLVSARSPSAAAWHALPPLISLLALSASAGAQHWFDGPLQPNPSPAGHPFTLRGDVDGDGDVDLISAGSGQLTVWANDGAGAFAPAYVAPLLPGEVPAVSALLDLDGDGTLDVAQSGGATVILRLGVGDGSFGPPITVPVPGGIFDLQAGQADDDLVLELGVFYYPEAGPTALWMDWVGGAPAVGPPAILPGYSLYGGTGVLDVDGDGYGDLLMCGWNQVDVLRTGAALTLVHDHSIDIPGGGGRVYPVAGDVDGDGDQDLVILDDSPDKVRIYENLGGGAFSMTAPQSLGSNLPRDFFLGDWDGDGDLDLLGMKVFVTFPPSATSSSYLLQHENQDGTFGFGYSLSLGYPDPGAGPADFDGDGWLDFASPAFVVFGDGTFRQQYSPQFAGASGGEHGVFDVEGDGDLDVPPLGVNDGTGQMANHEWPAPPPGYLYGQARVVGDFDGDGRVDYLVRYLFAPIGFPLFVAMHLLADDGLGGFVDLGPAAPPGVDFYGGVLVPNVLRGTADVDADGDLDVLVGGAAWLNDGSGYLAVKQALPIGSVTRGADVDGDGDDDLVTIQGGVARLLHQTAPLTFLPSDLLTAGALDPAPRLADLDGDGRLDLAVTEIVPNGSILHLFRGNGTGFDAPVSLAQSYLQQTVGADDVNGDGVLDLLTGRFDLPSNPTQRILLVYPGTGGSLAYGEAVHFHAPDRVHGFGDLDGDGDVDVVGTKALANRRFSGVEAGVVHQYGDGAAGAGGAVPLLGASGPVRPGSTTAAVNLVLALGGAPTVLAIATAPAAIPNFPFPGMVGHLDPGGVLLIATVPTTGSGPGDGGWSIPVQITPALAGLSLYHHALVLDPAATWSFAASNGLEIVYGL